MGRLAILITLAISASLSSVVGATDNFTIQATGPCTATILRNGTAYSYLNLTTLNSGDPTKPGFNLSNATSGLSFLYNPCTGMNLTSPCNNNQAVCQQNSSAFYALGSHNFTKFQVNKNGTMEIEYSSSGKRAPSRRSTFKLGCHNATTAKLKYIKEKPAGHYTFRLIWKKFCNLTTAMEGEDMESDAHSNDGKGVEAMSLKRFPARKPMDFELADNRRL